ncbi:MAG TPA: hypothetical protein PLU43_12675, partial [Lachnospiraceae bacterium]|nr:hypothetical protein [Lachnospiraceae bacterium]
QKELCEVLKDKADLGVRLRYTYQTKDRQGLLVLANETIPAVLKSLDRFFAAFERQWMRENKSFGFEIQCLRIGGLSKRLEFIRRVLLSYLAGEQEMIEELEQMRKPFHYLNRTDIDTLRYHMWSDMVSAGVIG